MNYIHQYFTNVISYCLYRVVGVNNKNNPNCEKGIEFLSKTKIFFSLYLCNFKV